MDHKDYFLGIVCEHGVTILIVQHSPVELVARQETRIIDRMQVVQKLLTPGASQYGYQLTKALSLYFLVIVQ